MGLIRGMCAILFLMAFLGVASREEGKIRAGQTLDISVTGVAIGDKGRLGNTHQVDGGGDLVMWKIGKIRAVGRTPTGSLRRVWLYRSGKQYLYDLEDKALKPVRIYPRDVIEVPDKLIHSPGTFAGRGGGLGQICESKYLASGSKAGTGRLMILMRADGAVAARA